VSRVLGHRWPPRLAKSPVDNPWRHAESRRLAMSLWRLANSPVSRQRRPDSPGGCQTRPPSQPGLPSQQPRSSICCARQPISQRSSHHPMSSGDLQCHGNLQEDQRTRPAQAPVDHNNAPHVPWDNSGSPPGAPDGPATVPQLGRSGRAAQQGGSYSVPLLSKLYLCQ
jgi:hypothetical protein